jgi:hypothetical protein
MRDFSLAGLASGSELSAAMDVAVPIFVLVDPMLGEPLHTIVEGADDPTAAREDGWQRQITTVALDPSISLPPAQHPYLVALAGPDDPLIEETLELAHDERAEAQKGGLNGHGGGPHRICGWLQTSMHAEQLAAQLSAMFRVNTAAHTKARYLRQLDRRVLALLRHVAGDARVGGQFGRLQSWTYLDVKGALAVLRSQGEEPVALRLSANEWAVLGDGELLHRAVAQWLGEKALAGEPNVALQTEELCSRFLSTIEGTKRVARQWPHRFAGTADLTTWAALAVLHPELPQLAAVARLMGGATASDEVPDLLRYLHPDIRALATAAPAQ